MERAKTEEPVAAGRFIEVDLHALQKQLKMMEFKLSEGSDKNTVVTMPLTQDITLFVKAKKGGEIA